MKTLNRNRVRRLPDPTLASRLSAPFPPHIIRWMPKTVTKDKTRALAVCYIDARAVQERLDEVLGADNWQDAYDRHNDGSVVCTLSLRLGGEWLSKSDVGVMPPDRDSSAIGDRIKGAYSDALKRAAAKWGVGRYLYRIPGLFVDYDADRKRLLKIPHLPDWAIPRPQNSEPTALPVEAAAIETSELIRRVREADRLMRQRQSTWRCALTHFGLDLPDDFHEPHSDADFELMPGLVPLSVLERIEAVFRVPKK